MFLKNIIIIFFLSFNTDAKSKKNAESTIEHVRARLKSHPRLLYVDLKWLENSAQIGIGYDLLSGSPVCFTGECQMEGFRQPVFKLDITKEPIGSCTNKLIPQYVNIQCLASTQLSASTESISTLDQLQESIKKGLEIGGSVGIFGNSFSYSRSRETRSIIDTMIQSNSTIYFTRATISWVRLTAFVPRLELSDDFKYVIENMPCCTETPETESYIREFIFDYFGTMYVKDLLLGGIAQQKIVISQQNRKSLASNGFTTSNEAEFKAAAGSIFSASVKLKVTDHLDQTKISAFSKYSQTSSITTVGGNPVLQSIEEWSKTIPSNPTVIKLGLAPIVDLLTSGRFPKDTNITPKRQMIERALQKYTGIFSCYKNCMNHGKCESTGYLGFGKCRCDMGWTGIDCSVAQRIPTGLVSLQVYNTGNSKYECSNGSDEISIALVQVKNPSGDSNIPKFPFCFLTDTKSMAAPSKTLCGATGIFVYIQCEGRNPSSEPCPSGYVKYQYASKTFKEYTFTTCLKEDTNANDLPGTICGMFSDLSPEKHVECDGYNVGLGMCPSGFTYRYAVTSWDRYMHIRRAKNAFCVKN